MRIIIFVILAFIAIASAKVCQSTGDPHYRTFGGRAFDFFATGEFLLFKRNGFECNSRLSSSNLHWKGTSLNSGVACRVNGVHFEVDGEKSAAKVFLNNKLFSGSKTIRGVEVKRNGVNFSVKYKDMEMKGMYVPVSSGTLKNYLNLYVYSHHAGSTGLCQGQKIKVKKTLFYHGKAPKYHIGKRIILDKNWVKIASGICKHHFKVGSYAYKACVYDMALEKKKRVADQYARFSKVIKGDFKKVCNAKVCHYYKRVTHVKHVKHTTHRWTKHKVVDSQKRNVAKKHVTVHKKAISNLNKKRTAHVNKIHQTAEKQIALIKKSIAAINKDYHKSIKTHVATRQKSINRSYKEYTTTVHKMNVWKKKVVAEAEKKRLAEIKKLQALKAQQIKNANAHYVKKVNAINKWKKSRLTYANNHHKTVVSTKKKWYDERVAFAKRVHQSTIRRLESIRKFKLKQLQCRLSAIDGRRHEEIAHLKDDYAHKVKLHVKAVNHHTHVSKTATKIIKKKHTVHHKKKIVTHKWKKIHSHK